MEPRRRALDDANDWAFKEAFANRLTSIDELILPSLLRIAVAVDPTEEINHERPNITNAARRLAEEKVRLG